MNIVAREEKKYLINIDAFRTKSHFLDGMLLQDEHNGTDGYIIGSLYFDTVYDNDFFEKLDGIETRRKDCIYRCVCLFVHNDYLSFLKYRFIYKITSTPTSGNAAEIKSPARIPTCSALICSTCAKS